ncbi:bacillithiol biosynthesis cysteine-adding enzyme BshC [Ferruginibacter profundus]
MNFSARNIPYQSTGFFSKLVSDYVDQSQQLQPFLSFAPTTEGIKKAIEERKKYPTNRKALVDVLTKQYATIATTEKVKANITALLADTTFTITTAHQPNIFTGHLYFVYKILHTVKLAETFKKQLPENNFVPVYYMGSEDADLDELGHVFVNGEKYEWQTSQTGAVGRMKVDKALIKLIDGIAGQVLIHPFGAAIIDTMKACYKEGITIEQATFKLVNELFKDYGVLVVLPDDAALKSLFIPVVEKELNEAFSHTAVAATVAAFPPAYKVQASGRELNLFYLKDDRRDRIEAEGGIYKVHDTAIAFSKEEVFEELHQHPERFSANVILRPVFQELILPNIAFIGGGGEIAYWLELKKVFEAVNVPYPVLVLRNSFMIVEKEQVVKSKNLGFVIPDLFKDELELLNSFVKRESDLQLSLDTEKQFLHAAYEKLKLVSGAVDVTLAKHTEALQVQALKKIAALEKKMLRAEKKKFEAQQRQLHKLKTALFPNNNLQERIENLAPFYAKWGPDFIRMLYANSLALEQAFVILEEV